MLKDDTIERLLRETQEEVNEYFSTDLSIQEIDDIITSQFIGAVAQLSKGIGIQLSYLGRFIPKDTKNINLSLRELGKLKEFYSDLEFEQEKLKLQIEILKKNKETYTKETQGKKNINVIDLIKLPNISKHGTIISDRLNELVEDEVVEDGE